MPWQGSPEASGADVPPALVELRDRVAHRAADLRRAFDALVEATAGSNVDDEHDPEGSTIAFERSQLATALQQAESELADVDAAVQRVGDGTYGRCRVCGGPIGAGRLEARPTATTCIDCASSGGVPRG